jgi:hypothetical protein
MVLDVDKPSPVRKERVLNLSRDPMVRVHDRAGAELIGQLPNNHKRPLTASP